MKRHYAGWSVYGSGNHWVACRFGVTMNTNSESGIIRMIDLRTQENRERYNPQAGWSPL